MKDDAVTDSPETSRFGISRAGEVGRATIRSAMDLLARQYRLDDPEQALGILKRVSQQHNVKLRSVAGALVLAQSGDGSRPRGRDQHRAKRRPPPLHFTTKSQAAQRPNRTLVLHELMTTVQRLADTPRATVQLKDMVHGGLVIEGQVGFNQEFLDFFSYVDAADTTCGSALVNACQVSLDDVATSDLYDQDGRAMMLRAGACSVLSTPLRDDRGRVWGMVSTHHNLPQRLPDAEIRGLIQRRADETARWLRWYDTEVMPGVVVKVHASAAAVGENQPGNQAQQVKAKVDSISAAKEALSRRFGISGTEADALLARMAAQQHISVSWLADRVAK